HLSAARSPARPFHDQGPADPPGPHRRGRDPLPPRLRRLRPGLDPESDLHPRRCGHMQRYARTIYIDPAITRYLVELVHATRNTGKYLGRFAPFIEYGASPRASIAFTTAGRALAMIRGRNYVIPED